MHFEKSINKVLDNSAGGSLVGMQRMKKPSACLPRQDFFSPVKPCCPRNCFIEAFLRSDGGFVLVLTRCTVKNINPRVLPGG